MGQGGRAPSLALIYGVFFASGASALVYQTCWQRLLGLFGGSDSISATLVVGAFLLGLGVGSLWAALFVDRLSSRAALLAFALCELLIAIYGAGSRFVFYDFLFAELSPVIQSRGAVFLVIFLALLVPTVLMGLSLPLLARAVVRTVEAAARQIGWLYGVNTLGAGTGALIAGWFVIGSFGYEATAYIAALLNLAVAVGALVAARSAPSDDQPRPRARGAAGAAWLPPHVRLWCVLVFVSGFIIISLEIVWFRVLGLMLQSSAYSFSLILAVFLVADAVGMLAGGWLAPRLRDPKGFFFWLQGAVALYAIGSIWLLWDGYRSLGLAKLFVDYDIVRWDVGHLTVILQLATFLVAPPAFLLGMSFPVTQRAVQDDPRMIGERVGLVQLANILGNTAGSIVTGLVLLRWLGTPETLRLVALLGLAFMAALLVGTLRRPIAFAHAALASVLVYAIIGFPRADAFWGRMHNAERGIAGEDHTGVVYMKLHGARSGTMYIAGHAQSGIPFAPVHGWLGLLGPLVHPDPKEVMVVGVGTGGTAHAAAVNPQTSFVRAVEIVGPVLTVLERFDREGGGTAVRPLFSDKRIELVVGDGRRALLLDERLWDVIESDAILPKTSHSGLLYSAEFFDQVRSRLKQGGIAVQWAPTERTRATFLSIFPHVVEIKPALIGSSAPIALEIGTLLERLAQPAFREHLRQGGHDLAVMRDWLTRAPPRIWGPDDSRDRRDLNTDLFPKDEYYLNPRKRSLW